MSEPTSALPDDWRETVSDTIKCLQLARQLAARYTLADEPPSELVPALLVSLTLHRVNSTLKSIGESHES